MMHGLDRSSLAVVDHYQTHVGGEGIRKKRPAESEAEAMEARMMLSGWLPLAFSAAFLDISDPPARGWHRGRSLSYQLAVTEMPHRPDLNTNC